MADCKCDRCSKQEYIPTHQFIKLCDEYYYLCRACHEEAQAWVKRRSSVRVSQYVALA